MPDNRPDPMIIIAMQSGKSFELYGPEAQRLNEQLRTRQEAEALYAGDYPGEITITTKFVESFVYYPYGQAK